MAKEEWHPLLTPACLSDRSARFSLQPSSGWPLRPEGLAKHRFRLCPTSPTGDASNPYSLLFSDWHDQSRLGPTDRGHPLGKDQGTNGESKVGRTSQTTIPGTVPYTPIEIVLYNLSGTTEPKQCCRRQYFPYSIVGAINSHTVRLPPYASGASTVLWAPAFTVLGEHGKTPPTCI